MSTVITFKQLNIKAHIVPVRRDGETQYLFRETGRTYKRERTAVKRAIIFYKRRVGIPERTVRKRRRVVRKRHYPKEIQPIVVPTLNTIVTEEGVKKYKVIETGKTFKRYQSAVNNALRYAKKRNSAK